MSPNLNDHHATTKDDYIPLNNQSDNSKNNVNNESNEPYEYKVQLVWRNVTIFAILYGFLVYGVGLIITGQVKLYTVLFTYAYAMATSLGVTGGAHRLWTHRAYKAKLPLRIFLMILQSGALQNDIYEWSRDHRVHHKFTDTTADPHNASRGFFFSHVGWLLCKKHRDVKVKGKTIDMSDLWADPVVRFQRRFYIPLIILFTFTVPAIIPWYFWNENGWIAFSVSVARYILSLNGTWLVNSAAHIWGTRPYDDSILPTENFFVSFIGLGEGWHNYHHVFPWDYKAAELGNYRYNLTTGFLDLMARIGQASELKTASEDMIRKRIYRTGDGSWYGLKDDKVQQEKKKLQETEAEETTTTAAVAVAAAKTKQQIHNHHFHSTDEEIVWGWGDKDMTRKEAKQIRVFNRIRG